MMKMKEKIKMDVNKCLTDLMEQYEYEDIKELFEALNNSIFKKELFAYMSKELDEENLKCPYCGNQHVHKNGKTPQGVQRYKCTCKKTFILRHNR